MEDRLVTKDESVHKERMARLTDRWKTVTEGWAAYRSSSWDHPGLSPVVRQLAKNWWPDWNGPEPGLGIYGRTGLGKTRCAWGILRRLHFAGVGVMAVDAVDFSKAASNWHKDGKLGDEARHLINRAHKVRVLLFDDLGKEPATRPAASALHDLLEKRTRNNLPIIWTSERTGADLAPFFGENYADGIIRRLRERTQIMPAEPNEQLTMNLK